LICPRNSCRDYQNWHLFEKHGLFHPNTYYFHLESILIWEVFSYIQKKQTSLNIQGNTVGFIIHPFLGLYLLLHDVKFPPIGGECISPPHRCRAPPHDLFWPGIRSITCFHLPVSHFYHCHKNNMPRFSVIKIREMWGRPGICRLKPHAAESSLGQFTSTWLSFISENKNNHFKPIHFGVVCYTALWWQRLTDK
jgi:hypothetical protein